MTSYYFTVEGHPISKARPRVVNKGGHSFAYMPKEYLEYRKKVQAAARLVIPEPMECVEMSILVWLNVNKGDGKPSRNKPDLEGIFGSIADALEGIAYDKDWSVFSVGLCRYYFTEYGTPESVDVDLKEKCLSEYVFRNIKPNEVQP